jgi:hypothetical protein
MPAMATQVKLGRPACSRPRCSPGTIVACTHTWRWPSLCRMCRPCVRMCLPVDPGWHKSGKPEDTAAAGHCARGAHVLRSTGKGAWSCLAALRTGPVGADDIDRHGSGHRHLAAPFMSQAAIVCASSAFPPTCKSTPHASDWRLLGLDSMSLHSNRSE